MTGKEDKAKGRVLLPQAVTPYKYDLTLEPDLERFVFDGEETVHVDVKQSTTTVDLHIKELLIKTASFVTADGQTIEMVSMNNDFKLHVLTLVFAEPLPVGTGGKLKITFQGSHNNQMAGFYRSGYKDINGNSKIMVSTQFESLDARRCFPCWDEPAMKAVFEVTLIVPRHLTAFSNMPELESAERPDGKRLIHFAPTPKMSTYLLAFVVGEFDFVAGTTKHGVNVRVYTPPGRAKDGLFGLEVAIDSLDLYDDFFHIHYPLPKLDMVAIPEFAMGAMENWGLVTYREVDILIDEKKASSQQKQRVATVVAHELAHQWFGNLVTFTWWDDLWLNEGFASWTENFCVDALRPDWAMWQQFAIDAQNAALNLDSLRSSHPIQVPIAHAEEIESCFDAISYCKGASVVRMAYAVLGPDDFKKGLQLYMNRHQYGNTETTDLWSAWEDVSGKPIEQMMASWTEQMGYPLLTVTDAKFGTSSVTLSVEQSWFLVDGELTAEEQGKRWTVPILYGTPSTTNGEPKLQLLTEKKGTIEVPLKDSNEWVKLNLGQHAPLRVLYPPELLSRLAEGVKAKTLPATDRAGLLLDTYNLCKRGDVNAKELLQVVKAYSDEDDSVVWEALAQILIGLDKLLLQAPEIRKHHAAFASSLVKPAIHKIGWDPKPDDGHLTKLLRATLIGLLSLFCWSEPEVLDEARRRFAKVLADPSDVTSLPSDYKVPVLSICLKAGGQTEYDQVLKVWHDAPSNVEKKQVYNAIGATSDLKLKSKALQWALDDVKLQDFFYVFGSVSGSSYEGLELTWQFYKDNFTTIKDKLKNASSALMDAVIVYSCGGYSSQEKAADIEAFFEAHKLPGSARKIAQTLERIRVNSQFLTRLEQQLKDDAALWEQLSK